MMTQWQGKKWYCYGTSMTDNVSTAMGVPGTHCGHYSKYLAKYAGLEEHNFGRGGRGIVPALHKKENIKDTTMRLDDGKAEADLITVELIPNDCGKAPLGDVTDTSDDTFCGNLNQIIEYLLKNTKAVVVILIATRARYKHDDKSVQFTPVSDTVKQRLVWENAVETVCRMHGVPCWNGAAEAGLGYYRVANDNTYLQDQIHLSDKGGEVLAKYYWGKLQCLYPID